MHLTKPGSGHPPPRARQRQSGVTLLEVLIAVLIVSFGLLGMAGLQSVGMKYNLAAAQRTAATMLANDIADRMRANMAGVNAGAYNSVVGTLSAGVSTCTSAPGCAPAQLATNDIYEWQQALIRALGPSAMGIVCLSQAGNSGTSNVSPVAAGCTGGSESPTAIKIWWYDRSSVNGDPSTPHLPDYWVVFKP